MAEETRTPSSIPPPPPSGPDEPSPLSLRLGAALKHEPPPPPSPADQRLKLAEERINTALKGWRLTKLLGVGRITAAYEALRGAKDAKEHAVVKVMVGKIANHEAARSLFLRASYAANRFSHPRVLPIVEDGTDEQGIPFVVRPWVDSEPLATLVEAGPVDETRTLRIAEQVLDALEMAHAHGIVHGALSPRNILITPRNSVRLCDFATPPGVASTRVSGDEDVLAERHIGPFTAPERCTHPPQVASEQADVYSIGACMYFAVTGQMPRGDAKTETALASTQPKPIRELAPSLSDGFVAVVEHALKFDPLHRYDSAYGMLGDVRRVMAGRKPKLGDALAPVPSQSVTELSQVAGPPSSRRLPYVAATQSLSRNMSPSALRERQKKEWRGNFLLIVAIALLVGIATFVLVREREEDSKGSESSPAHSWLFSALERPLAT